MAESPRYLSPRISQLGLGWLARSFLPGCKASLDPGETMPARNLQVRRKHDARTRPHARRGRPEEGKIRRSGRKRKRRSSEEDAEERGASESAASRRGILHLSVKKYPAFLRHPRSKRQRFCAFFVYRASCFIAYFLVSARFRPWPPGNCLSLIRAPVEPSETRTILSPGGDRILSEVVTTRSALESYPRVSL